MLGHKDQELGHYQQEPQNKSTIISGTIIAKPDTKVKIPKIGVLAPPKVRFPTSKH